MMNFANIDLKSAQIIIDGVTMNPCSIEGTIECCNFAHEVPHTTLKVEMEIPLIEYQRKKLMAIGEKIHNGFRNGANQINSYRGLSIVNVIFNEPATIVFWSDKSKTVVKAQNGEPFDPEKGLAMAILKRMQGNKGNYNNEFHQWTKNYQPKETNK